MELDVAGRQEYLSFNERDLIIIDKIRDFPENSVYNTEYILVMICNTGKLQFDYDGQLITLHKGELFLGMPDSMVSDYMVSPDLDCKLLAIKPSEVMASSEFHVIVNSTLYIKSHPVAHLSDSDSEDVFAYYDLICSRIRKSRHRYHNGEVRSLINAFLLKVVGIMNCDMDVLETSTTVHGEQLVEKFIRMVNEDCGRNRSVEYYADRLHITPKYLSILVRSSLGRTPTDIIRALTIKEIERYLRYTSDNLKQISIAMHFPNTSFFGKYFKQHTGMTPMQFRDKYRK